MALPTHGGKVTREMSGPRYMHVPTFMRTPLIEDPTELDIALVGVPYDGAVTNRPGARHGPREMRNASSNMRAIHHVSRINPYELCHGGDVPFINVYDIEAALGENGVITERYLDARHIPGELVESGGWISKQQIYGSVRSGYSWGQSVSQAASRISSLICGSRSATP